MLKKRLIPVLIIRNGKVVQSEQFDHTNIIHSKPEFAVEFFNKWAADEIILLDVTRDRDNRDAFYEALEKLCHRCFLPLTVGGWVTDLNEIRDLLAQGADKVIINTEAIRNPSLIKKASRKFGSQCIVGSIDARKHDNGDYEVFADRGREPTNLNPFEWASELESLGAGEIYITSIDHDGSRQGYDLNLVSGVVKSVNVPVIAFGGVSEWDHLVEGIEAGAEAVSAANTFHYRERSVELAKKHLKESGVNVR